MKLNKNNADIVWGENKRAWFRNGEVIVETEDGIETMTVKGFRAEHEEAFAADGKCLVEYGGILIEHTLCKDFHDPLFKAIDIIEGGFRLEMSPGKLAEKLYKIEFPRGVVTLEFGDQVILINSFEDGLDKTTLFNHFINQVGMKYNLSADEIGRYSIVPPLEWDVMGFHVEIRPVSDEIYRVYRALKEDIEKAADDFVNKELDFKVDIYSEFMGVNTVDLSTKEGRVGIVYNLLSMIYGSKGSRDKIMNLDKKYNLEGKFKLKED